MSQEIIKNNKIQTQINKKELKKARKEKLFSQEPVFKSIMKISLAGFISMFIFGIYEITDALIAVNFGSIPANNFNGSEIRLALQCSTPLYTVAFAVVVMIGIGTSTRLSILLGKKDLEAAKALVSNAIIFLITTLILVCGILTLITPLIVDNIAKLAPTNAQPTLRTQATWYTWILLWGLFFNGLGFFGTLLLRAEGSLLVSSSVSIIGTFLNIIGDVILVIVLHISLIGSAISTASAWIIQFILVIGYFLIFNRKHFVLTCFKNYKFQKLIFLGIFLAGLTPFVRNFGAAFNNLILNRIVQYIPDSAKDNLLPTYSTITQILIIVLFPSFGIVQGGQSFLGYNAGSRDLKRLKDAIKCIFLFLMIYFTFGEILIFGLNHQLLSLFAGSSSNSDPGHLTYFNEGKKIIFIGYSTLFLLGPQLATQLVFQSTGFKKVALIVTSFRYIIIFIPVVLLFSIISILLKNNTIFWVYMPTTEIISASISLPLLWKFYKDLDKPDFLVHI